MDRNEDGQGISTTAGALGAPSAPGVVNYSMGLPGLADGSRKWIQVFKGAQLGDVAGYAPDTTSEEIPVVGNKVVAALRVVNTVNQYVFMLLWLEGSYDGETWEQLAYVQQTGFGYATITQKGVAHAFVRLYVHAYQIYGGYIPFDAWVEFSSM